MRTSRAHWNPVSLSCLWFGYGYVHVCSLRWKWPSSRLHSEGSSSQSTCHCTPRSSPTRDKQIPSGHMRRECYGFPRCQGPMGPMFMKGCNQKKVLWIDDKPFVLAKRKHHLTMTWHTSKVASLQFDLIGKTSIHSSKALQCYYNVLRVQWHPVGCCWQKSLKILSTDFLSSSGACAALHVLEFYVWWLWTHSTVLFCCGGCNSNLDLSRSLYIGPLMGLLF